MKACLFAHCICAASLLIQGLAAEPSESDRKLFQATMAKAEKGDAQAQCHIGMRYERGRGVAKDDVEAVKWYRKAADQGNAPAQFYLGFMYAEGNGVTKDEAEAVRWYRKAADQGDADAQFFLGTRFASGRGVAKDEAEAVKWWRKSAEKNHALAQLSLGNAHTSGKGVEKDEAEAAEWYRKAAEQHNVDAQMSLGVRYAKGIGLGRNDAEAAKWYRRAAEQNDAGGQSSLAFMYWFGTGVVKDELEAYKWFLLSSSQGNENARKAMLMLERDLTSTQRAEGQRMAREWKPRKPEPAGSPVSREGIAQSRPESTGTGFFITEDGYFISNQHVAGEGATVRILTVASAVTAKVVKVDKANDLALLKAEGKFTALPVLSSRGVRLGATAATVGFPNTGLQGFAPKLAKGEIASLAGAQDDARHFQISAPIQPGNSGGALVDERGNVIGVVVAKLSQRAALATSGALAENVNYAVKSSYLLSFLESVPEVAAKLKEAHTKDRKFEDVVKSVEQATVLVLVY